MRQLPLSASPADSIRRHAWIMCEDDLHRILTSHLDHYHNVCADFAGNSTITIIFPQDW